MKNRNEQIHKKTLLGRITVFVSMLVFSFLLLVISIILSGIAFGIAMRLGLVPNINERNLGIVLLFMLVFSIIVGMIYSIIGGRFLTRPIRALSNMAKQIKEGNYDVHIEPQGSFELRQLCFNFNEMARELGSVDTLRNDFVTNISHEYKTPIVSIRGFAKLLKKKNLSEEKRDEYLDIIISEADRMAKLSGNVLTLSKLDTAEHLPEKADFSLDEQLRQAVLLFEMQLQKKNIDPEIELDSVIIRGNEELLDQVWVNIIGNAIKFTPDNGTISIKLRKGTNAVVTISDTGVGMDTEAVEHLFDKFYQADSSRTTDGNGLGLSLAKKIIDVSGGTIDVKSVPGEGSTFVIELPLE